MVFKSAKSILMEILKICDTDMVHLLKQMLMIVLLYLDETIVRERNNFFFASSSSGDEHPRNLSHEMYKSS